MISKLISLAQSVHAEQFMTIELLIAGTLKTRKGEQKFLRMQILQYFKGQVSFSVTSPPSEFQIVQNNLFTLTRVYAVHLTIYMFALIKENVLVKRFLFLVENNWHYFIDSVAN